MGRIFYFITAKAKRIEVVLKVMLKLVFAFSWGIFSEFPETYLVFSEETS